MPTIGAVIIFVYMICRIYTYILYSVRVYIDIYIHVCKERGYVHFYGANNYYYYNKYAETHAIGFALEKRVVVLKRTVLLFFSSPCR